MQFQGRLNFNYYEYCTSLLAHESGSIRILIFPMYFPYWLSQLTRIADWGSHAIRRARH
eukprot:COSAG06_NODE_56108_length_286_cov_1.032086_1_plen_58_part_10